MWNFATDPVPFYLALSCEVICQCGCVLLWFTCPHVSQKKARVVHLCVCTRLRMGSFLSPYTFLMLWMDCRYCVKYGLGCNISLSSPALGRRHIYNVLVDLPWFSIEIGISVCNRLNVGNLKSIWSKLPVLWKNISTAIDQSSFGDVDLIFKAVLKHAIHGMYWQQCANNSTATPRLLHGYRNDFRKIPHRHYHCSAVQVMNVWIHSSIQFLCLSQFSLPSKPRTGPTYI